MDSITIVIIALFVFIAVLFISHTIEKKRKIEIRRAKNILEILHIQSTGYIRILKDFEELWSICNLSKLSLVGLGENRTMGELAIEVKGLFDKYITSWINQEEVLKKRIAGLHSKSSQLSEDDFLEYVLLLGSAYDNSIKERRKLEEESKSFQIKFIQ